MQPYEFSPCLIICQFIEFFFFLYSDTKDIRQCYLYTLAMQSQAFQHFRHVALISSHQDHYVTFESARIEMSGRAEKNMRYFSRRVDMI
jgi:hypothetical protein